MVVRLILIILCLWSSTAMAASAVLVPSSRTLEVGQSIAIELQLVDLKPGSPPTIPTDTGLGIQYQGMSTMHEMINFQARTIYKLRYVVTGIQEGVWAVGPFRMLHNGKPIEVAPLRLTVEPRSADTAGIASIRTRLSDSLPYEGQVITYTIQYQFRKNVSNLSLSNPEFQGFESLNGVEPLQTEHHIYDEQELIQIRDVIIPLVAKDVGNHNFRPVQLSVDVIETNGQRRRPRSVFDEFFQQSPSRRESFISEPLTANVRPLPTPPVGFDGLIGTFRLEVTPSARTVNAGESVNIALKLSGEGDLQGYTLPSFEQKGFRSYSDESQRSTEIKDGLLVSSVVQNIAIVPESEGRLIIDPIEIVIFDTKEEAYMTLRTTPIALDVAAGDQSSEGLTQFSEAASSVSTESKTGPLIESLGMDIRSVDANASIHNQSPSGRLLWLVLSPLLGLLLGGGYRYWVWSSQPQRVSLRHLPTEPRARLQALDTLFRETIAGRLKIEPTSLLPHQIDTFDAEAGRIRAALGHARFGGQVSAELDEEVQHFVRRHA